jgi:CRP-like cAMP-binding protein
VKWLQEVITHLIKEGGLMGSVISFLTGEPSRYVLETIEPVTAYAISKNDLEQLFATDKKWEKFGRKIITSFFIQIEYNNINKIKYSTKERFLNFMKQNPDLVLRVPQKHLASYLEIQPETFSRLKHLMVKEK